MRKREKERRRIMLESGVFKEVFCRYTEEEEMWKRNGKKRKIEGGVERKRTLK